MLSYVVVRHTVILAASGYCSGRRWFTTAPLPLSKKMAWDIGKLPTIKMCQIQNFSWLGPGDDISDTMQFTPTLACTVSLV